MIEEWNYGHDADITIGEVHISKTAKTLLICLIILFISLSSVGIYFRSYIYDYIANPSIVLAEKEVNIEVRSVFKPEKYIANSTDRYTYTVLGADFKTDKLDSYEVTYNSKNKVHKNSIKLKVNVVDTTAPEIELTQDLLSLKRGDETNAFNANAYLKSVTDNYTENQNIKIDFTRDLDFSKDEVKVIYSATDNAGNISTKTLNIAVLESDEKIREQIMAEQRKIQEEQQKKAEAEDAQNNNSGTNNSNKSASSTEAPKKDTKKKADPYIKGVHNVTVKVGTDFSTISSKLLAGVSGSGTVTCDPSNVNTTVAGTYTVYWSSSDGATATCKVTVKE